MLRRNATVKPFLVSLVEPVAYLKSELPGFWASILVDCVVFAAAILLAAEMRLKHPLRKTTVWGLCVVFIACALTVAVYPFGEKWTKGRLELTVLELWQPKHPPAGRC